VKTKKGDYDMATCEPYEISKELKRLKDERDRETK